MIFVVQSVLKTLPGHHHQKLNPPQTGIGEIVTGTIGGVEAKVMDLDYIILGGGNRTSKLKVPPAIFGMLPDCDIVEELAKPA